MKYLLILTLMIGCSKSPSGELILNCGDYKETVIARFYERYEWENDCRVLLERWKGECINTDLSLKPRYLTCRPLN